MVMDTVMAMKPNSHVQKTVVAVADLRVVMIVNLIGLLSDLNAVTVHGVSLVLIVRL